MAENAQRPQNLKVKGRLAQVMTGCGGLDRICEDREAVFSKSEAVLSRSEDQPNLKTLHFLLQACSKQSFLPLKLNLKHFYLECCKNPNIPTLRRKCACEDKSQVVPASCNFLLKSHSQSTI